MFLTDTDSFYYTIKTENIYGELYKHKDLFDFKSLKRFKIL